MIRITETMERGPILNGAIASPDTELPQWAGTAVWDIVLTLADREGKYRRFRCQRRPQGSYVYNVVVSPGEPLT